MPYVKHLWKATECNKDRKKGKSGNVKFNQLVEKSPLILIRIIHKLIS